MDTITADLPKPVTLRPDQLAIMLLLFESQRQTTLTQLPTGTGKSCKFGPMAYYINKFFNKKVAVLVPTESLAAYQQKHYAPWASVIGDDLTDPNVIDIHYVTYADFLSGKIPLNTSLLVDEIDSLFFSDVPYVKGNQLLSAIVLLRKYKLIGVTATFRGGQGASKLLSLLKDVKIISTGTVVPERVLQLDIIGKVPAANIKAKVVEIAKDKQITSPVIVILPSIEVCEEYEVSF